MSVTRRLERALPRFAVAILLGAGPAVCTPARPAPRTLRVCADPNNLPFSNRLQEGFENRIAELLARAMGADVEYTWWPQRRGFIRNTLGAKKCDVVMGVPFGYERVATTRPYYRSTYVFLYRKDRGLRVRSLDDPILRGLTIGVQLVGDDYANTPPVHALSRRGIVGNLVGFTLYGDYREPNPPARIVEAVVRGEVDLAIVWGPLAGYFAKRSPVPLEIVPVTPPVDNPFLPFVYDIAIGVRREDQALLSELDSLLASHRDEIRQILREYGVPMIDRRGRLVRE